MTKEQFIEKYSDKAVWCKTEELAKEFLKMADSCGFNNIFKKEFFEKEFQGSGVYFYIYEKNDPNRSFFYNDIEFNRVYETVEKKEIIEYKPEEQEEKHKNLIPLIAKELGVEIGEEFKIVEKPQENTYKLENDGLKFKFSFFDYSYSANLNELIIGEYTIKKLPQAPTLTEDEKVILRNLPKEYKWIARDEDDELRVFNIKPFKSDDIRFGCWNGRFSLSLKAFEHIFQFIKFENEEPYNIEELLKGE